MNLNLSEDQRDVIVNALEKYLDISPDNNDAGVIMNLLPYLRNNA